MDFEVLEVGEGKDWQSPDGARRLTFYPVSLRGDDGLVHRCEWGRKQDSQAPRAGDAVAGQVVDSAQGLRFKMDFDRTKELGYQRKAAAYEQFEDGVKTLAKFPPIPPSTTGGAPIQSGPTTPQGQTAKDRAIARMAAQKVAVLHYVAVALAGRLPTDFSPHQVSQAADFFETDAQR